MEIGVTACGLKLLPSDAWKFMVKLFYFCWSQKGRENINIWNYTKVQAEFMFFQFSFPVSNYFWVWISLFESRCDFCWKSDYFCFFSSASSFHCMLLLLQLEFYQTTSACKSIFCVWNVSEALCVSSGRGLVENWCSDAQFWLHIACLVMSST